MQPSSESRLPLIGVIVGVVIITLFAISLGAVFLTSRLVPEITDVPLPTTLVGQVVPTQGSTTVTIPTVPIVVAGETPTDAATALAPLTSTFITEDIIETPPANTATPTPFSIVIAPPPSESEPPINSNTTAITGTSEPITRPPANLEPYLEDGFNSADSGWPVRSTQTSSAAYANGQYQLSLNAQAAIVVSSPLDAEAFRLEADVIVRNGNGGLIFLAAQPATFYRVLIRADGTYAVQMQQGTDTITELVGWTASPALRVGIDALNKIQVERRGDRVDIAANGQPVATLTIAEDEVAGQFGFVLTSETGQAQAAFDNLIVQRARTTP